MSYHRARYDHLEDAHAVAVALEAFRPTLQVGVIGPTTALGPNGGEVDEYEVWFVVPPTRRHPPSDVEPHEDDFGWSRAWDDE